MQREKASNFKHHTNKWEWDLRERRLATPHVNQRCCQATEKLLFSAQTGQLGVRIPSLPVRCHKPFIGRTAANLKNKSIKARRPPTCPGPKEGFKEGRASGVSGDVHCRCQVCTTIPTLFLPGGVSEIQARGTARTSGQETLGPGSFPTPGLGLPPLRTLPQELRRPSSGESCEVACGCALEQPPALSRPGALGSRRAREANSPGRSWARGRGGAAALQREPTNFRGRPAGIAWWPGEGRAGAARRARGGGGRPRARAAGARGSRRGMGPAASAGRAARPPAGPAALPAPSRLPLASAAARRARARRAARNCFHCKQKKATHDQAGGGEARGGRRSEGRDGAEEAEGVGERENVGLAAGGLRRWARTRRGGACPRHTALACLAPRARTLRMSNWGRDEARGVSKKVSA
ncbi:uncharacterized protein LOC128594774 [Nycticebus coucang]|uniref:uncharacterized protein LOC128594774 n=1 Tax=Nycticebus coucang TaxID=9470 RepID=UPI00234D334E|nr:uncharacterized protein LOC128594774 [Nycticebus coucang]